MEDSGRYPPTGKAGFSNPEGDGRVERNLSSSIENSISLDINVRNMELGGGKIVFHLAEHNMTEKVVMTKKIADIVLEAFDRDNCAASNLPWPDNGEEITQWLHRKLATPCVAVNQGKDEKGTSKMANPEKNDHRSGVSNGLLSPKKPKETAHEELDDGKDGSDEDIAGLCKRKRRRVIRSESDNEELNNNSQDIMVEDIASESSESSEEGIYSGCSQMNKSFLMEESEEADFIDTEEDVSDLSDD